MKSRYLLIALFALLLQDAASEGKRWWSHIEFLADDALEGRNVGTPGFEKAAAYVESQFRDIGLKPGGASGYRQPVKLESRTLVAEQSKLSLVRDGEEEPIALGQEASLTPRGELDGAIEAPMVFVGYGLSIPEANWDDLAGQDLHGKIAVYVAAPPPADVSDNVRSHVSSAAERWAVLKKAGAIGSATLPNPAPPTAQTDPAATPPPAAGRGPEQAPQPSIVLADRDLQEQAGQMVSITITRQGAAKFLAGRIDVRANVVRHVHRRHDVRVDRDLPFQIQACEVVPVRFRDR